MPFSCFFLIFISSGSFFWTSIWTNLKCDGSSTVNSIELE